MTNKVEEAREALAHELAHVGHFLPDQGPISVFVHHNTLHAYTALGFHAAIAKATEELDAEPYMSEAAYHAALASGRIRDVDLDAVLDFEGASTVPTFLGKKLSLRALERLALTHPIHAETPAGLAYLLEERHLATRLPSDLDGVHATAILVEGARYVREIVTRGDLAKIGETLVGERGFRRADDAMRAELDVPLRVDALKEAIEANAEPFVVRALFSACRRLTRQQGPKVEPRRFVLGDDGCHRDLLRELTGDDIAERVDPILIRASAAYLDTGMAYWPMPDRDRGFYAVMRELVGRSSDGPAPWLEGISASFRAQRDAQMTAHDAILDVLADLGVPADARERYLLEVARALPGWAGMFARLERNPRDRPSGSPPASLADFLAVRLVYERQAIRFVAKHRLGYEGPLSALLDAPGVVRTGYREQGDHDRAYRLFLVCIYAGVSLERLARLSPTDAADVLRALDDFTPLARRRLLHEAYERRHRHQILSALKTMRPLAKLSRDEAPRFTAVFCIDDREESIRRHLEETSGDIETFGTAGFFGLPIDFVAMDDPRPVASCPVVMKPTHVVREEPTPEAKAEHAARRARRRLLSRLEHGTFVGSRSLVRGTLLTLLAGGIAALPMLARILFPRAASRFEGAFRRAVLPRPKTVYTALREDAANGDGAELLGFTVDEAAARIEALLVGMGKRDQFPRLFVVIGHGAASINNPHESAYGCGACGGHPGLPNARLFAQLANEPRVRAALAARGVAIPSTTWFVGGYHDTTNDAITFFDLEGSPDTHRDDLAELGRIFDVARAKNAHERTRRFASAPKTDDPQVSLRHVEGRAENLAEPRPEYNHATNAVCVVGRRAWTKDLFLDRRAFLVSYDPSFDPDGALLERTLLAVGPVGAGINLEYYFSYVDTEVYGCGTKLPHNITGYLGVMSGHSSDLRPGLSRQMVEIHEPVRLLTIVESTPEALLAIAERQPLVKELVVGRWIQLVAMDPTTGKFVKYTEQGFVPVEPTHEVLETVGSSVEWYRGQTDHLPPARIAETKARSAVNREMDHAA